MGGGGGANVDYQQVKHEASQKVIDATVEGR
jgi:hypothetical protein